MTITREAREAILAHARDELPRECCGLLIGTGGRIDGACRSRNLESGETRFTIDPRDHFAAIRQARASGREVLGVYHSHPSTPAEPSARDLAEASYPEYLYLIVSLRIEPAEIRTFCLAAGNFLERPLVCDP